MARFSDTVPRSLTPTIRKFCCSIALNDPVFIPSLPVRGATTSFCFENVQRKIDQKGGTIAFGWAIWHMPNLYFEAEHHAVWRNGLGNLIDVSPQLGRRKRILFLLDESAVYDPTSPRVNIMGPDGASALVHEIVALGSRRHDLLARCRVPGTAEIQLYEADQLELTEINKRIQAVVAG